ncbi:MAG: type IV pilus assembly protein PilM [Candidatus Competibacterales bacterium]
MALFKKTERMLGVDLSPTAVKLVELSRSGKRIQIEAAAMEPLPEGAMTDRNPSDLDQLTAALKRAVKGSGTTLKKVALAVPTSSVITRTITMPAEYGEDEIEANIQVEAAQYVPFPLEEIYLDFQTQMSVDGRKTTADTQEVMIVASRRENVDLRDEVVKEAGLKAVVVDVEAYALENAFALMRPVASGALVPSDGGSGDLRTALVEIGTGVMTLYVFDGDRVTFTREQIFGTEQLIQAMVDTYGMTREQAVQSRQSGELPADYLPMVVEPFRLAVAEQISNALQFFFSSSHYNSVDYVVLVGDGALVEELDEAVGGALGISTVIGNPFAEATIAKRVNRQMLQRNAPSFATACGLAMRSFG